MSCARPDTAASPFWLHGVILQLLLLQRDKVQNLFLRSSYALPTVQAGLELEAAEVPQVAGVCFLVSESSFELTGGRSCGEEASPCLLLGP